MAKEKGTMNTKKLITAALTVAIAIMLIPVQAQARHTEDTFYNQYAEGQEMGTLSYAGNTHSVLFGMSQAVVDTGNVELFSLSAPDHLLMYAHSDKAFDRLYDNSQNGTKINVTLDDCSVWYEVFNAYWIDQTTFESEQYLRDFYYNDVTPLTLITCNHRSGVRGRWIVQCTYSSEPVQAISENVVAEDVVVYNEADENTVTVEEIENVKEQKDAYILTLNLLKMKKSWVADYLKSRGF